MSTYLSGSMNDGNLYKSILRANRGVACSLTHRLSIRYASSFAARLLALHPAKRISRGSQLSFVGCALRTMVRGTHPTPASTVASGVRWLRSGLPQDKPCQRPGHHE